MPLDRSPVAEKLGRLSESLGRKVSISEQIAETLRNLIISGDLNPGDPRLHDPVAKQLGVGQPTVREALVALEHQGLVVRRSNQGCVVTTLTSAEVADILRIRGELEVLAVDLAVENATEADLDELLAITEHMKDAARERNVQRFFAHDFEWHNTLWRISGNSYLPKVLSQVLLPLLAFLFIRNLRNNAHIDMMASADAHVQLVQGIRGRDRARAREIAMQKFGMFATQHANLYGSEVRSA